MRALITAIAFLTIFPAGKQRDLKREDFGAALTAFPLVGALIGLSMVLILPLAYFLPYIAICALLAIAPIIITGAIHLDGFADACDGFYAGGSKDDILRIMRDSRVGTIGAAAIASLLILKFSLLVSIRRELVWKALIMMPVFARWVQAAASYLCGYARKEGKARYFLEGADRKAFLYGSAFTFTLFFFLAGAPGIILLLLASIPIFSLMRYVNRRIGGMTGDTIGALSEAAEIIILLGFAASTNIF